jgi:hypothetical protein
MAYRVPPTLPVPTEFRAAITAAFDPVAPALQHQDELVGLLTWARDRGCTFETCVEIGTHFGGTLACWATLAASQPHPLVVGIDLPLGEGGPAEWGGMYRDRTLQRNQQFELTFPHVRNIVGNSQYPSTVANLSRILSGRLVDFLFIDGDHTAAGVTSDFLNYSPFVREGGIIAFHDVNPTIRAQQQNFAVPDFFESLTYPVKEIFSVYADWGGIGAIQV